MAISFSKSSDSVEVYDIVEVKADVLPPHVKNPFTGATFKGQFELADGSRKWQVEGFCDSKDGSVFRMRFMPPVTGDYKYSVEYRQRFSRATSIGTFHVSAGRRRGPIRVDSLHPWHFVWEGTGEHYFFNGTTAYWLMGWQDEKVIQSSIERLHRLKVNRLRVTIAGRSNLFYGEPVMNGESWTLFLTPWPAAHPEDVFHPGFDYSRFSVDYWQKVDRALRYARERDMIVSLVLDMNDGRTHPAAFSVDERRFIHYAIDRFGAFSNITWDLGDDLDLYRSSSWTHETGELIKQWDDHRHLATSHPVNAAYLDRASDWFDFSSFQEGSRNQHAFILRQRKQQEQLGRIIPQANEEYGYEDHYPMWAQPPQAESADALRRSAWDIAMAGGYQTTGETTRRGTNVWPDTGGGWMNGRGDDSMTMLQGYAHMFDFFTSFEWWAAEPHDELVSGGDYCLAEPGKLYAIYLPHGGKVSVQLPADKFEAAWFDPATGNESALQSAARGPVWNSPPAPNRNDWALLLKVK